MPSLVNAYCDEQSDRFNSPTESVRAMPQTFTFPGWHTVPSTGDLTVTPPMMPANGGFFRAPSRIGTLPDPVVYGYAEIALPVGRTVDLGFSPHVRAGFDGQGHYDQVPTWNVESQIGVGTPATHGKYLRQGILTQLTSYNPPSPLSAAGYVAALTGTRDTLGIGGIQGIGV